MRSDASNSMLLGAALALVIGMAATAMAEKEVLIRFVDTYEARDVEWISFESNPFAPKTVAKRLDYPGMVDKKPVARRPKSEIRLIPPEPFGYKAPAPVARKLDYPGMLTAPVVASTAKASVIPPRPTATKTTPSKALPTKPKSSPAIAGRLDFPGMVIPAPAAASPQVVPPAPAAQKVAASRLDYPGMIIPPFPVAAPHASPQSPGASDMIAKRLDYPGMIIPTPLPGASAHGSKLAEGPLPKIAAKDLPAPRTEPRHRVSLELPEIQSPTPRTIAKLPSRDPFVQPVAPEGTQGFSTPIAQMPVSGLMGDPIVPITPVQVEPLASSAIGNGNVGDLPVPTADPNVAPQLTGPIVAAPGIDDEPYPDPTRFAQAPPVASALPPAPTGSISPQVESPIEQVIPPSVVVESEPEVMIVGPHPPHPTEGHVIVAPHLETEQVIAGPVMAPSVPMDYPPYFGDVPLVDPPPNADYVRQANRESIEAPINPCPRDPRRSFPAIDHGPLLELFAVDIARRTLLAHHPCAARYPIRTVDLRVRRQGHYVRTYAKLSWYRKKLGLTPLRPQFKRYESEISASLVYHAERRRVSDLSYIDNAFLTWRNRDYASQVIATYNEDFAMRDDVGMPFNVLSRDTQLLRPFDKGRFFFRTPFREPHPFEKSLRTVRTEANVTANQ